MIRIRNRTGAVLYTSTVTTIREAIKEAVLRGANLADVDLAGADLAYVDLADVDLGGVDLRGADLRGAVLRGANLGGVDLGGVDLAVIRADVWEVLDAAPNEVEGLLAKIEAGEVDGSYYVGDCSCLLGTIATERGVSYRDLGIEPDSARPAERWFTGISPGGTPAKNQVAAITVGWIREWQAAPR